MNKEADRTLLHLPLNVVRQ